MPEPKIDSELVTVISSGLLRDDESGRWGNPVSAARSQALVVMRALQDAGYMVIPQGVYACAYCLDHDCANECTEAIEDALSEEHEQGEHEETALGDCPLCQEIIEPELRDYGKE